ncbi:MAG: phage integrase N-terminal SAM-like domain-containing protein [Verrucomicrobiota bacterium]
MRNKCQLRHYSIRTEQAYGDWAKKFILFHHKRHPLTMGTRSRSVSDASRR